MKTSHMHWNVREYLKDSHLINTFGLAAIMALCIGAYINGLFGGFQFDDYPNIVNNNLLQAVDGSQYHWWLAALSSDSGILRRPISMLSFAANIYWLGMNPVAFKIINLVIHLLNAALIYRLSLWLLPYLRSSQAASATAERTKTVALLVTALWMLHPLHVSNVLYIVQRMNLLATLFILIGLYCYVAGRRRSMESKGGLLLAFSGLAVFGLLATFCKENGVLAVLYAFVIEVVCFRFRGADPGTRKSVVTFFLLILALPLTLFFIYLLIQPEWLANGYSGRGYTLAQRLLTEPRVLMHYLQWILIPLPSQMGLYHDDIPLSTGLFSPISTIVSISVLVAAMLLAWKVRNRAPAVTFAVAWFLAGHALESTLLPLEIVFEHRNYLPMAGLLLGMIAAAGQMVEERAYKVSWIVLVVPVVIVSGLTADRSHDWGDPIRLARVTANNHPDSPRSLYDAGRAIIISAEAAGILDDSSREKALPYFQRAMTLDKIYVFPATSAMITGYHGKEIPKSAIDDLEFRLRKMPLFQATPFLMLLTSIGNGTVLVVPEDVERLVTAAMENPSANQAARAMILNNYGRYLFVVRHDAQSAVSLTLAAAEMAPGNPFFQVNLVRLALALGQPDIAAIHLKQAEDWNVAGIYTKDIEALRLQIDEQKGKEGKAR